VQTLVGHCGVGHAGVGQCHCWIEGQCHCWTDGQCHWCTDGQCHCWIDGHWIPCCDGQNTVGQIARKIDGLHWTGAMVCGIAICGAGAPAACCRPPMIGPPAGPPPGPPIGPPGQATEPTGHASVWIGQLAVTTGQATVTTGWHCGCRTVWQPMNVLCWHTIGLVGQCQTGTDGHGKNTE